MQHSEGGVLCLIDFVLIITEDLLVVLENHFRPSQIKTIHLVCAHTKRYNARTSQIPLSLSLSLSLSSLLLTIFTVLESLCSALTLLSAAAKMVCGSVSGPKQTLLT